MREVSQLGAVLLVVLAWCASSGAVDVEDASEDQWLDVLRKEADSLLNCGKRSYCSRHQSDDTEFNVRCHCEEECSVLRDCCVDRAVRDSKLPPAQTTVVRGVAAVHWGCGRLGYILPGLSLTRTPQEVSMVKSCPEAHPFSSMCARRPVSPRGYSYLLDVPVLGAATHLWYQNVYCAACHRETSIRPYEPTVHCSSDQINHTASLEQANYVAGNLTWVLADGTMCFLEMRLNSSGPGDVGWLRSCLVDLVDECPPGTDHSLAEKCRSYNLYSIDKDREFSQAYKNPHCARCHNVTAKCKPTFQIRKYPLSGPSLGYVLDVGWDDEPSARGAWWNCSLPHGLWDVLHGKCVLPADVCGPGQVFDGVACLPGRSGGGPEAASSCARTTLLRHEYSEVPGGGGGIVLNSSLFEMYQGQVFQPGEFQRLDDGSVAVCRDLLEKVHDDLVWYSSAAQVCITVASLSVSVACLVAHIAAYSLLPKLRNLPGRNLVSLSWALLLAQLLLLLGVRPPVHVPRELCLVLAAGTQYLFLASFCWMNVMSVDIWRTFSSSLAHANSARAYRKYSAWAWGVPALLVGATLAAEFSGGLAGVVSPRLAATEGVCWFGSRAGQAVFFTAPVVALLLANSALFAVTVYKLHLHSRDNYRYIRRKNKEELTASLPRGRDEARLYLYLKLFVVMGMSWVCGFLATLARLPALMYPFLVLNGVQGALIFVMFDVKRSVVRMLWERLAGPERPPPSFLHTKGGSSNNNSSSTSYKKKVSHTSSSLMSSGLATDLHVTDAKALELTASNGTSAGDADRRLVARDASRRWLPQTQVT